MDSWIIVVVVLPVLAGFFKNEIGKILTAWNIYRLRAFDLDGDPLTSDKVQILNGAIGVWEDAVIEKYVFSLRSKKRGVFLLWPDGGREKVGFIKWSEMRKRMGPNEMS